MLYFTAAEEKSCHSNNKSGGYNVSVKAYCPVTVRLHKMLPSVTYCDCHYSN